MENPNKNHGQQAQYSSRDEHLERIAHNTDVLRRAETGRAIGTLIAFGLIAWFIHSWFS